MIIDWLVGPVGSWQSVYGQPVGRGPSRPLLPLLVLPLANIDEPSGYRGSGGHGG